MGLTHTTDQERAEFEKWIRSQPEWLNGAPWLDVCTDGTYRYAATQFQFRLWQAARRAQVVPDELRNAAQRAHDWMERQAKAQSKGGHATFDLMMLREERDALAEALAAAPQPPEAAPVQMPEPISKALEDCRSRAIDYATCPSPYNNTRMETAFQHLEHQVRQLLATQEPST